MAIIHPLQQRMSSTETKVVVAVIWVLALLLAFPQYYYSTTYQMPDRVVCYIAWPENTTFDFKKLWVSLCWSFSTSQWVFITFSFGIWVGGIFVFRRKKSERLCFVVDKRRHLPAVLCFSLNWKRRKWLKLQHLLVFHYNSASAALKMLNISWMV